MHMSRHAWLCLQNRGSGRELVLCRDDKDRANSVKSFNGKRLWVQSYFFGRCCVRSSTLLLGKLGHLSVGKHIGRQPGVVPTHQPFITRRSQGPVNPESREERNLRGVLRKNPEPLIRNISFQLLYCWSGRRKHWSSCVSSLSQYWLLSPPPPRTVCTEVLTF